MKTFLKVCAAFAVLTASAPALAKTGPDGHWEWRTRPAPGPRSSFPTTAVRVWVQDSTSAVSACDCSAMKAGTADCMIVMPAQSAPRSNC